MIDLDEVTVGSTRVTIADEAVRTLGPEIHLIHAAMHVALGDVTPRLGNVRDIAMLLDRTDLNLDSVMRTVVSWQAEAPFAAGLSAAGRLGAVHPLIDWADDRRRSRRERWLMACYAEREGRFRRQSLASLAVLSWRHKLAFARSVTASRRS